LNIKYALSGTPSASRWYETMSAYLAAKQRHHEALMASQNNIELEGDADMPLREVLDLEHQVLIEPAPNRDALLFKMEIWRLERAEIDANEWRALTADVERLT
jgi:hypothetical protein